MTYEEALGYITGLLAGPRPVLPADQRLARIARLLRALRLETFPCPVILVAGTKGKGSTSTMLAAIAAAAGRRVGLYTKPHVSDYRERIRVGSEPIARDALVGLVARVAPAVEAVAPGPGGRPTYFEVSLALALRHFVDERVDLAIVEVGIGGRHDAANVLDPILSIITPISRDHTELLGQSLEAIARHKAGIMRAGRPVIVAPQVPEVDATLVDEGRATGARLVRVSDVARWSPGTPANGDAFDLQTTHAHYGRLVLGMRGRHQVANAATAVVAAETLFAPRPVSAAAVAEGLHGAALPGRFECLEGPPTVVLDVAHNPASMQALRDALDEYYPDRPVVLVFGMIGTHDPIETAGVIAPRASLAIVTEPPDPRALPATQLAVTVSRYINAVVVAADRADALHRARAAAGARDVVCVTGSVYLVGDIRDRLAQEREAGEAAARRVG
ncbi:MAG: Mur ligase family protein [Armatimonadota bacterium]|nr:Mur ligase family protein [Armatimonadota bacterium]